MWHRRPKVRSDLDATLQPLPKQTPSRSLSSLTVVERGTPVVGEDEPIDRSGGRPSSLHGGPVGRRTDCTPEHCAETERPMIGRRHSPRSCPTQTGLPIHTAPTETTRSE